MLRHYLIDASALVPFFLTIKTPGPELQAKQTIARLLELRAQNRAALYVPNFCMAECSKAFAKISYNATRDYDKASQSYTRYVEDLLDIVSGARKKLIQSYELKREHLINVEDVFKAEHKLFPHEKHNLLSGLDALLVSMGRHLAKTHGLDHVVIITAEERMTKVCNNSRAHFPKAINITKQPIPG